MNTKTKICGLSTPESIKAAIENGASHIGLVFYDQSPRNVDIEAAAALTKLVPDSVRIVGLFIDPDNTLLEQALNAMRLDLIQLHGKETPERVLDIKERSQKPIMKALPISDQKDLETVPDYQDSVDYFLFDAKPDPTASELPGGNGLPFDWEILKDFQSPKAYFLAGGLTHENVGSAIDLLKPYGVDVSSGVESTSGVKDSGKIASFLTAVKQA
ncbi:MAG: phosphoribosylanthranilate isomerase [Pseudomonadota bacterium]